MIRFAILLAAMLAALPAPSAWARSVTTIMPVIACTDQKVQRNLRRVRLDYGDTEADRQAETYIDDRRCIWLDGGTEGEVLSDPRTDEICIEIVNFHQCLWLPVALVE